MADIDHLGRTLANLAGQASLASRFRALFTLRAVASPAAVELIANALRPAGKASPPDALLGHELAYCLGQIGDPAALVVLEATLRDQSVHPMVRHEAAEAMGAIADVRALPVLKQFLNDPHVSVRETCELAVQKIELDHLQPAPSVDPRPRLGEYGTVDPTPSMIKSIILDSTRPVDQAELLQMKNQLLDEKLPLFQRYRAMFGLRDAVGRSDKAQEEDSPLATEAVEALADGFKDKSALFRHEIAYVFGQLSHPASVPALLAVLENRDEDEMVRHEAAEALGSIATPDVLSALKKFASLDEESSQVVRQSCEVALDMYEYETSKDFQYTLPLNQIPNQQSNIPIASG